MKAAVYRGSGEITIEERPPPAPGPGQVVVEVSHCGICGSDLHLMLDGWGPTDVVHGHEYSGIVAAVGTGVDRWTVGDPVSCGPEPSCGVCEACRARQPSQCERRGRPLGAQSDGEGEGDASEDGNAHSSPGGFATHVTVDAGALRPVPEGLPLRAAALAEPLAVALHAVTRSGIGPGESALVLGVGPIGALVVAVLRARGVARLDVVEPAPGRQALARALGADRVISPDDLPESSPFAPDAVADDAVHVVFECSGKRRAMEAGLGLLRRGGRLVLVGAGIEAPRFDPNRILLNELTVTGAFCYDHDGIDAALALLAEGVLPLDVLLEPDDVGLDGLATALTRLAGGEIAGKVLVAPAVGAPREEDTR
jgi:(R,R)-butanediol dehydrogenase/meso-butanediol dehydrogenase/diacetyl reductase